MKRKLIYVSLPIAGVEDTVYRRNEEAKTILLQLGYDIVSPIDTNGINNEDLKTHTQLEKTAYYMGKDIEHVILCDGICMCYGWENSKGCKVEKYTAEVYDKEILYLSDLIENYYKGED